MWYFIFSLLFIILMGVLYYYFKGKINKRYMDDQKLNKISEDQILRELRILRKQLIKVDDKKMREVIMKKIDAITKFYN